VRLILPVLGLRLSCDCLVYGELVSAGVSVCPWHPGPGLFAGSPDDRHFSARRPLFSEPERQALAGFLTSPTGLAHEAPLT
jgi:hypothetical protein